nr:MAG TPA: nin one binding protein [Caudoviricetes sp.]
MKCSKCGNEFEGKFCPECGTPAEQDVFFSIEADSPPQSPYAQKANPDLQPPTGSKRKNRGCLKIGLIVLGVLVVLSIIGSCMGGDTSSSSDSSSSSHSSSVTSDFDFNSSSSDSSASNMQLSMDLIAAVIKASMEESYGKENCEIEYDDTGITVSVWSDGVASGAALIATGSENQELTDSWEKMVESLLENAKAIKSFVEENGHEVSVSLNVLNDLNHDNYLLMIINDVVVYDATK